MAIDYLMKNRSELMKLSNTLLLTTVWGVAITMLMLLSAAIASADEAKPSTPPRQIVMVPIVEPMQDNTVRFNGRQWNRTMLAVSDGEKLILYLLTKNGRGMYPIEVRDLDRDFSIEPNLSKAEKDAIYDAQRRNKQNAAREQAEKAAELENLSAQEGELLQ